MESMTSSASVRNLVLKGGSSFAGLAEVVCALRRVKSQHELESAALQLLDLARTARLVRHPQMCNNASNTVLNLPVSPVLHVAADYYRTISREEFDTVRARSALVRAADNVPPEFRARIIFQVGRGYELEGNIDEAARYYIEAAQAARGLDPLSRVHALCNLADLRSEEGDNARAVAHFESLSPIVRALSQVYSVTYCDYLNNFAVVLSRAGLVDEARRNLRTALASPFAPRFPEWQQTEREIEEAATKELRKSPPTLRTLTVTPRPATKRPLNCSAFLGQAKPYLFPEAFFAGKGLGKVAMGRRWQATLSYVNKRRLSTGRDRPLAIHFSNPAALACGQPRPLRATIPFGAITQGHPEAAAVACRLRGHAGRKLSLLARLLTCVRARDHPPISLLNCLTERVQTTRRGGKDPPSSVGVRGPPIGCCVGVCLLPDLVRSLHPASRQAYYLSADHAEISFGFHASPDCNRSQLSCPCLGALTCASAWMRAASCLANSHLAQVHRKHARPRYQLPDGISRQADGCSRARSHPSTSAGRALQLKPNACPWRTV